MLDYENEYLAKGCKYIAGIDEAGRGPLAGPVCVAIAIMPLGEDDIIEGVNDSKKLTEKKRDLLYDKIIEKAIAYHIELVDEATTFLSSLFKVGFSSTFFTLERTSSTTFVVSSCSTLLLSIEAKTSSTFKFSIKICVFF